jgi:hypothetical protein
MKDAPAVVDIPAGLAVAERQEQRRQKILRLEAAMLADPACDKECKDFPVKHFRAPGMVARQMFLPKDGLIVGKIHKHAHLNHISFGHVRVETEHGPMEIKGPHTFTSIVGTKRAVMVLEDTLWTTFHLNPNDLDPENEADMRKLEDEIIAKSYEDVPSIGSHKEALKVGVQA